VSEGEGAPHPARIASAHRRRHRRRTWPLRLLLGIVEGIAAFAGLAMLATALLALRLAWGPIEVDWLTPALTAVLNAEADPLTVAMAGTSVSWGTRRPTVDLVARDLHLVDPSGTEVLRLPSLAVSLSVKALFEGRIAPTSLVATGPRVHIVRAASGEIDVVPSAAPEAAEPPQTAEPWPQMLRALAGRPRPGDPLGAIDRVSVVHMDALIDDRENGLVWHLDDGNASADRSPDGLEITIGGRLGLGAVATAVKAALHLDTTTRTAAVTADFSEFDPAALAASLPEGLHGFEAAQFGVVGKLTAALDVGTMRLGRSSFTLHGGAGALVDPRLTGGRLKLKGLDLDAAYEPEAGTLELRKLAIELDGPTIEATGTVTPAGAEPLLGITGFGKARALGRLKLRNLPLDRFGAFWPPDVAPDAREWIIQNLTVGRVDTLDMDADATIDPAAAKPVAVRGFSGTIAITHGMVNYLDGLPKLEGVDATIALSPQKLDFVFTAGRMQGYGLSIDKGTATIDGFESDDERITIDMGIKGPATDVMSVLDVKRLQYAKAIGMPPERVGGSIAGTLHFRFRLKKDLPINEVDYGAQARLTDLSVVQVALNSDLTAGSFDLLLDHDHVSLDGIGRLGDVPVKLTWSQRIAGSAGDRSVVHAVARLDPAARARFGFDFLPSIIHGPVDADIDYRVADEHSATAAVKLDLTPADLAFDLAGWSKSSGVAADSQFRVDLTDGHVVRLANLVAHGPALDLAGGLDFQDGMIVHGVFDRLAVRDTDLTGTVEHAAGAPWALTLRCKTLDFEAVRKSLTSGSEPQPGDDGPSLVLDVTADKALNGPGHELRQVAFKGSVARHTLLSAVLAARIGTAGKLDFHLDPVEKGGGFAIVTDDFGALFKVAGIIDNVVGGRLSVTGSSKLEGDSRRFTGHAEGGDYRIVNGPFLTRLLSLASFQAIGSLAAGEGIPFSTLKADLSLKSGVLDIAKGRAYGSALGLTADGWIDTRGLTLALEGTLVPANMLNSALSGVPLLGPLLVGPEGSGLFAVNLSIHGHLAEPDVAVNPLSALAPGFVRNLFLFDAPGPGIKKPPAPKPPG